MRRRKRRTTLKTSGRRVLSTYCQMCCRTRGEVGKSWWDQSTEPSRTPQCNKHKNSCSKHVDKSPQNTSEKASKKTLEQFRNVAVWSFWGHSPGPQHPFDCRNSFESCSQYECILWQRGRSIDEASLNLTLIENTKCDGCGVVCVLVSKESGDGWLIGLRGKHGLASLDVYFSRRCCRCCCCW